MITIMASLLFFSLSLSFPALSMERECVLIQEKDIDGLFMQNLEKASEGTIDLDTQFYEAGRTLGKLTILGLYRPKNSDEKRNRHESRLKVDESQFTLTKMLYSGIERKLRDKALGLLQLFYKGFEERVNEFMKNDTFSKINFCLGINQDLLCDYSLEAQQLFNKYVVDTLKMLVEGARRFQECKDVADHSKVEIGQIIMATVLTKGLCEVVDKKEYYVPFMEFQSGIKKPGLGKQFLERFKGNSDEEMDMIAKIEKEGEKVLVEEIRYYDKGSQAANLFIFSLYNADQAEQSERSKNATLAFRPVTSLGALLQGQGHASSQTLQIYSKLVRSFAQGFADKLYSKGHESINFAKGVNQDLQVGSAEVEITNEYCRYLCAIRLSCMRNIAQCENGTNVIKHIANYVAESYVGKCVQEGNYIACSYLALLTANNSLGIIKQILSTYHAQLKSAMQRKRDEIPETVLDGERDAFFLKVATCTMKAFAHRLKTITKIKNDSCLTWYKQMLEHAECLAASETLEQFEQVLKNSKLCFE